MPGRTCPCCGHRTLPPGDEPTWSDCPVCLWTDAPDGADQPGPVGELIRAQQCFTDSGACAEYLSEAARQARSDEPKDPAWNPLIIEHDREKKRLLESIHRAFDDVILGEGRSLDDAEAADMFRDADEPRRHERWTDVTSEELERFDVFLHLDAHGFRFYAPACMVHFLEASPSPRVSDDQFFMFTLAHGRTPQFDAFDPDQLARVRDFLEFVGRYHPQCYGDEVRKARARGL